MPHKFHVQIGGIALYQPLELGQIGVAGGDARQRTGLLQGDDVPLLVADDALQVAALVLRPHAAHHLAVGIFGLAGLQVVIVAVNAAAADIGIADDERVALCGSQFIEILLHGILRKTIANG